MDKPYQKCSDAHLKLMLESTLEKRDDMKLSHVEAEAVLRELIDLRRDVKNLRSAVQFYKDVADTAGKYM